MLQLPNITENLAKNLAHFLNEDEIEKIARESKFVQRKSKLTGFLFFVLMTFGRLDDNPTFEQLASKFGKWSEQEKIDSSGLHRRIGPYAIEFFKKLMPKAFQLQAESQLKTDDPLFEEFERVLGGDSTGFGLPDSLAEQYPGSGGSASKAGCKIQSLIDLKTWVFEILDLRAMNEPDNKYVKTLIEHVKAKDLLLLDLGYFALKCLAKVGEKGAFFLSRFLTSVAVYKSQNQKELSFDLWKELRASNATVVDFHVFIGSDERLPVRMVAFKMPQEVVNERRRKARANAKKKGGQ